MPSPYLYDFSPSHHISNFASSPTSLEPHLRPEKAPCLHRLLPTYTHAPYTPTHVYAQISSYISSILYSERGFADAQNNNISRTRASGIYVTGNTTRSGLATREKKYEAGLLARARGLSILRARVSCGYR